MPFESALSGVPCVFAAQSSLGRGAAPPGTATIVPWEPRGERGRGVCAARAIQTARARQVDALAAAARALTWAAPASALVRDLPEAALAPVRDAATLSRDAVATRSAG